MHKCKSLNWRVAQPLGQSGFGCSASYHILQRLKILSLNPFFLFFLSSQHLVRAPEAADLVSKLMKILWVAGTFGL